MTVVKTNREAANCTDDYAWNNKISQNRQKLEFTRSYAYIVRRLERNFRNKKTCRSDRSEEFKVNCKESTMRQNNQQERERVVRYNWCDRVEHGR